MAATARQNRIDNKFKDNLLCEWCNRWGRVDRETWKHAIRDYRENGNRYIFFCARSLCKASRPSGMLSSLKPWQQKKVIWGNDPETYTRQSAQDQEEY